MMRLIGISQFDTPCIIHSQNAGLF